MENTATTETPAEAPAGTPAGTPAEALATAAPSTAPAAQPLPETVANAPKEGKAEDAAKPAGAPETYQPFDVPGGLPVDGEQMAAFGALFKELNLSQEAAQKLVSLQAQQMVDTRNSWYAASQADTEFGGQNLKANLETAMRAVDAFGTPELKRLLVDTGLGDHPEVIRMFFRAGRALAPDRIVSGQSAAPAARGLAERLYHTT